MSDLQETIEMELEGVRYWRGQKAAEYPDDRRNRQAVSIAEKLLANPTPISAANNERFDRLEAKLLEADDSAGHHFSEAQSEIDLVFWKRRSSTASSERTRKPTVK